MSVDFNRIVNSNFHIQFLKHYFKDNAVYYQILLFSKEDSTLSIEFADRYSEMDKLHDSFKEDSKSKNYPNFPEKKIFGNTEEKFLNKRLSSLQSYFSNILTHKEFSKLKSVKNWIYELFKKYYKPQVTSKTNPTSEPTGKVEVQQTKTTDKSKLDSSTVNEVDLKVKNMKEIITKCSNVIEKYSKLFIDLSEETHIQIGDDDISKEKKYLEITKTIKISSRLFSLPKGDNSNFECLGMEEPQVKQYQQIMSDKIKGTHLLKTTKIAEQLSVVNLITPLI